MPQAQAHAGQGAPNKQHNTEQRKAPCSLQRALLHAVGSCKIALSRLQEDVKGGPEAHGRRRWGSDMRFVLACPLPYRWFQVRLQYLRHIEHLDAQKECEILEARPAQQQQNKHTARLAALCAALLTHAVYSRKSFCTVIFWPAERNKTKQTKQSASGCLCGAHFC